MSFRTTGACWTPKISENTSPFGQAFSMQSRSPAEESELMFSCKDSRRSAFSLRKSRPRNGSVQLFAVSYSYRPHLPSMSSNFGFSWESASPQSMALFSSLVMCRNRRHLRSIKKWRRWSPHCAKAPRRWRSGPPDTGSSPAATASGQRLKKSIPNWKLPGKREKSWNARSPVQPSAGTSFTTYSCPQCRWKHGCELCKSGRLRAFASSYIGRPTLGALKKRIILKKLQACRSLNSACPRARTNSPNDSAKKGLKARLQSSFQLWSVGATSRLVEVLLGWAISWLERLDSWSGDVGHRMFKSDSSSLQHPLPIACFRWRPWFADLVKILAIDFWILANVLEMDTSIIDNLLKAWHARRLRMCDRIWDHRSKSSSNHVIVAEKWRPSWNGTEPSIVLSTFPSRLTLCEFYPTISSFRTSWINPKAKPSEIIIILDQDDAHITVLNQPSEMDPRGSSESTDARQIQSGGEHHEETGQQRSNSGQEGSRAGFS